MQHCDRVYCDVCHVVVALQDPSRVQKELKVYHEPCLRRKEREQEQTRQPINSFHLNAISSYVH